MIDIGYDWIPKHCINSGITCRVMKAIGLKIDWLSLDLKLEGIVVKLTNYNIKVALEIACIQWKCLQWKCSNHCQTALEIIDSLHLY